ncbi:MAG: bifunctional 2-polyprenyl-6-hydroxyphenol methylase/3-demethylubiquinol 3-O-methyltransferase UbiG [Gammaproteobacteria bacterium]|nr:bifunctional 2-polyprenyl-6-hydroxyphenol methylase/3-demethylubiquinol 3-O-methyltransferase UbiG [Gammaproteobacteria bacterium]
MSETNIDAAELERFSRRASRWWDSTGSNRTLHDINPARLAFIERHAVPAGARCLDVGCGGGILTEALARRDAQVTGLDASRALIDVARMHAGAGELDIDYVCMTAERYAAEHPAGFDIVTCMEMLEHVPDPGAVVAACIALARPGGLIVFSTLNRTPLSYALAIAAAEYVLRIVERGTHDYARFIKPSELAGLVREGGAAVTEVRGMHYNPFTHAATLTGNPAVNYLLAARRA